MKKVARLEFVIVVRPALTGELWRAHMKDDNTTQAQGETPMLAIRNLAVLLEDEDAASAPGEEYIPSAGVGIIPAGALYGQTDRQTHGSQQTVIEYLNAHPADAELSSRQLSVAIARQTGLSVGHDTANKGRNAWRKLQGAPND